MSLFDFLFPEQAEASHLRRIATEASLMRNRAELDSRARLRAQKSTGGKLRKLEEENAMLSLLVIGLLQTLAEKEVLTLQDVFERLKSVDLLDGVKDGKVDLSALRASYVSEPEDTAAKESDKGRVRSRRKWMCNTCDHVNAPARTRCLFCGANRPT